MTPVEEGGGGVADWFVPRIYTVGKQAAVSGGAGAALEGGMVELVGAAVNHTLSALAGAVFEQAKRRVSPTSWSSGVPESAGIGLGWLRRFLGRSEWTLPCLDIKVRL